MKYESNFEFFFEFLFFGYLLEPYIEILCFFLNFGHILAIENLKKHLTLAFKFFKFWAIQTFYPQEFNFKKNKIKCRTSPPMHSLYMLHIGQ
jgi:hypothetical protein